MAITDTLYAPSRQAPLLLVRAQAQTIKAPVRHGSTGALQAPSAGTVTIERADGSELVSGAAVTVSSSIATYTLTPSASETLGAGWSAYWDLTMTDGHLIWQEEAYLCEYVPPCVISAHDLYGVVPELKHRIPEAQGPDGTDEGWQPQIDMAYYELIQALIDDARKPWLIRSVTAYRRWLLARAVQIAVDSIPATMGDHWSEASKKAHFAMVAARSEMRVQYSSDSPGVRRAGSPVIRLSPAGRPSW